MWRKPVYWKGYRAVSFGLQCVALALRPELIIEGLLPLPTLSQSARATGNSSAATRARDESFVFGRQQNGDNKQLRHAAMAGIFEQQRNAGTLCKLGQLLNCKFS